MYPDYEPLTQGERHSMLMNDFVAEEGREHPDQEWIADPYDTWRRNPFFTGEPGPHPEDDYAWEDES